MRMIGGRLYFQGGRKFRVWVKKPFYAINIGESTYSVGVGPCMFTFEREEE